MAKEETNQRRGDVEVALAALGGKFVSEVFKLEDGRSLILQGDELSPLFIDAVNPTLPDFVTAAETVNEPKSFIDYVREYKAPTAICMASLVSCKIVALLDYHGKARLGDRDTAQPQRNKHSITLLCPFDVDYAKWRGIFGKFLPQKAMIEFIEDNIHTIGEPPAADLLEALSNIEIERVVKFKSGRNDKNGNIRFTYDEQDGDRTSSGEFSLPDHIEIVVPIFQGGNPQRLTAKLRFRMKDGDLVLGFAVPGIENIERTAFRSIGESVRAETDTPVFYTA